MTPHNIKYRINLIAVLEDIQEQLMLELQPEYRHGLKMMLNDSIKATKRFIRECDRIHGDRADNFGIAADQLRELLDNTYNKTI